MRLRSMLPSGAAAGREDDRVAAREGGGERRGVLALDVEQADLGAERLELRAVAPPCAPARPGCARPRRSAGWR